MPPASTDTQQRPRSGNVNQPFVPKAQPIQPWSAEPELVEETSSFDTLWKRPVKLEPPQPVPFTQTEPFEVRRIEELDFSSRVDASELAETTDAPSEDSAAIELELEQQLLAEMSSLAEAAGLSEVESDLADTPADVTVEQGLQPQSNELTLYRLDAEETPLAQETRELEIEVEVQEEGWQGDASDRTPEPQNEVVLPQSNWPSPTLYPLRSPKKRKSLAAIDLPSFPRFYPS